MLSNRGFEKNAKKYHIHMEEISVPMPLYRAEAWGERSAERREVNVLEMKCLQGWLEC